MKFKSQLIIGNKNLKEVRTKNPLLSYEISYDKTEEEIIKYVVNRKCVGMNKFINKDRTLDLIKSIDAILQCTPKEKGRFYESMQNKNLPQFGLRKKLSQISHQMS